MQSILVKTHPLYNKRYPFIGDREVVPTEAPLCINPVTGLLINITVVDTPVALAEGMTMQNLRGKMVLVVINTDEVEDLIVTPVVTGKIQGYDADAPSITVTPESAAVIGPFSINHETAGFVDFDFSGDSESAVCAAGRLP